MRRKGSGVEVRGEDGGRRGGGVAQPYLMGVAEVIQSTQLLNKDPAKLSQIVQLL